MSNHCVPKLPYQLPRLESTHVRCGTSGRQDGHMPIAWMLGVLGNTFTSIGISCPRPYRRRILAHTGNQRSIGRCLPLPASQQSCAVLSYRTGWLLEICQLSQYVKRNGVLCGKFMNNLCKNEPFMHNNSKRIPNVYEQVRRQKQQKQNKEQIRRMKKH